MDQDLFIYFLIATLPNGPYFKVWLFTCVHWLGGVFHGGPLVGNYSVILVPFDRRGHGSGDAIEMTSAMRAKQRVIAAETRHLHCPLQAVRFSWSKDGSKRNWSGNGQFWNPSNCLWQMVPCNGSRANDQHNPSVSKGQFTQRSTEEESPLSLLVYSQFKQTTAGQPTCQRQFVLKQTLTLCL